MSEEKIQKIASQQLEEQEIDLIELARNVWAERKLIFKACGIAALIGLVVAFSIPKEYSTKVTLAPESAVSGHRQVTPFSVGVVRCQSQRPEW